jgi:S1-C subfamily serine protease
MRSEGKKRQDPTNGTFGAGSNDANALKLTTAALLALIPLTGTAHHPLAEIYDPEGSIRLTGVIAEIRWSNPHVAVLLDRATPSGISEQWRVEMDPPHILERKGIGQGVFAVGDEVIVTGYPALDCSRQAEARTIELADGRTVEVTSDGSWSWRRVDGEPVDTTVERQDCD